MAYTTVAHGKPRRASLTTARVCMAHRTQPRCEGHLSCESGESQWPCHPPLLCTAHFCLSPKRAKTRMARPAHKTCMAPGDQSRAARGRMGVRAKGPGWPGSPGETHRGTKRLRSVQISMPNLDRHGGPDERSTAGDGAVICRVHQAQTGLVVPRGYIIRVLRTYVRTNPTKYLHRLWPNIGPQDRFQPSTQQHHGHWPVSAAKSKEPGCAFSLV